MPDGGFEVLAVPITIANGGARDAAVLGLELDVKNLQYRPERPLRGHLRRGAPTSTPRRQCRQKTPFSALVIAGRSAWTGTIVFYPVSYSNRKALTSEGPTFGAL